MSPTKPAVTFADAVLSDHAPPRFAEPWQAELFACTHALSKRGIFSWSVWAAVFAAEIAAHPQGADEDIEQAYFRQWLAALETLLARAALCQPQDISALAERWRQAYLHTPHGQAAELAHADAPCALVPHHAARGQPVAVSPARGVPHG